MSHTLGLSRAVALAAALGGCIAYGSLGILLLCGEARAADALWTAGTGNFNDTANWDTGVVPVNGDVAIINNGGTAQLSVSTTTSGATLRIGEDGTGAMTVTGTGTYETSGDIWIGRTQAAAPAVGSGSLTVDGGATVRKIGGYTYIGAGSDARGAVKFFKCLYTI